MQGYVNSSFLRHLYSFALAIEPYMNNHMLI